MTGCNNLLDVNLPAAVTSAALDDPSTAELRVNSVMATFECAYSTFSLDASGYSDNWQRYSGSAGSYTEYNSTPVGGECDTSSYNHAWVEALLTSRGQGYETYNTISGWSVANKEKLLAETALYVGMSLEIFGEHMCDFAISSVDNFGGPLSPDMTLDSAEAWVTKAMGHITSAGGDFAIGSGGAQVTSSISDMAYGIRARIRYANGDLTGAAADAANVPNITTGTGLRVNAVVLREEAEKRRNMVASVQGNGGGVQTGGFLQGFVRLKTASNEYGISMFGNNPVTGQPWPDSIPFTGYINLAIDSEGRAVDDNGYAITTDNTPSATPDTRIPFGIGNTSGGPDNIEMKYTSLSDDIPLVNWREMRLIEAEAAGMGSTATGLVNQVRSGDGLPPISGAYQTLVESDATAFRYMLQEERRRALWLEGRYWTYKTLNPDIAWFPRSIGQEVNSASSYQYGGGVRVLMPIDEYQTNPLFTNGLDDRGEYCDPNQAPTQPY